MDVFRKSKAAGPANPPMAFESGRYNGGKPMARRAAAVRMTYAEYLEAEAISEIRHEFLDVTCGRCRATRRSTRRWLLPCSAS